jgi:hypothetical protein
MAQPVHFGHRVTVPDVLCRAGSLEVSCPNCVEHAAIFLDEPDEVQTLVEFSGTRKLRPTRGTNARPGGML